MLKFKKDMLDEWKFLAFPTFFVMLMIFITQIFDENIKIIFNEDVYIQNISVILILQIILFIFLFIIKIKPFVKVNYIKDVTNVIEPSLSQGVLNNTIGVKEVVMSMIINLTNRGNLEILDNKKIKIVNRDNLAEYEEYIIDLIFGSKRYIVNLEELRKKFINNESLKIRLFSGIIQTIGQLYRNKKIYADSILSFIKVLTSIIYIIIVYILWDILFGCNNIVDVILITLISLFSILIINFCFGESEFYSKLKKHQFSFKTRTITQGGYHLVSDSFGIFMILAVIIGGFIGEVLILCLQNIFFGILIISVFLMNTTIFVKSNTHIYTSIGKEEYKKVLGLKKYIKDSLNGRGNIDSIVVWDEYLPYAIAFGMLNKVQDKFKTQEMKDVIIELNDILILE